MVRTTREKLYEKVWSTPIVELAKEFGLSDTGLAKLCKRHEIPTPSRGYWAKFHAGQRPRKSPLLKPSKETPKAIFIENRSWEKAQIKQNRVVIEKARPISQRRISEITVPSQLKHLHWIVARWVDEHKHALKQAQKEKSRNRYRTDLNNPSWVDFSWGQTDAEIDLTERDKYRFRVTSAFLKGLEAHGGRAIEGKINGEIQIECSGQKIDILVKEKMRQDRRKPSEQGGQWTAYPHHHNAGMMPSGFLRFHVKPYLSGLMKGQWVETDKLNGGNFLAEVINGVLDIGTLLVQRAHEREEKHRQYLLEQQRKLDEQRIAKLEADRWDHFRAMANNWQEASKLRRFLDEMELRRNCLASEIDGIPIQDYLEWVRAKIDKLDPFVSDLGSEDP